MKYPGWFVVLALLFHVVCSTSGSQAADKETIATVQAYISQRSVKVEVFGHNESGLFEYFNLITFDDTKLDYVSIEADRGALWTGYYPTHVEGNKIYVHGWSGGYSDCLSPDTSEPGAALFHINFNVKSTATAGTTAIEFLSEFPWDGHWIGCDYNQISPSPDYYDGGVEILGHACLLTADCDTTSPGQQAVVNVYLHNDLDLFEYFCQLLFESANADIDSIIAQRGTLHYGNYPTHVSGDTIFVHGWADADECFYEDHSTPGASLFRIFFTVHADAPIDYVIPLNFIDGELLWDHWVGCDLTTTDSFDAVNGWVYVKQVTDSRNVEMPLSNFLAQNYPNPFNPATLIRFGLDEDSHVSLKIYDVSGRMVRKLVNSRLAAGPYKKSWDGRDSGGRSVSSGIYFYRVETGLFTATRKMILLK
jgi:hypothetical protein